MNLHMTKLTIAGATALTAILFASSFSPHDGAIGVTPCFAQSGGSINSQGQVGTSPGGVGTGGH